eukprot:COSAG01_NODE_2293_length_7967_cov_83.137646_6_plen_124_part_00
MRDGGGGCDVGGVCFVPLREGPMQQQEQGAGGWLMRRHVAGFVLRCGANLRCVSVCLIMIMSSDFRHGFMISGMVSGKLDFFQKKNETEKSKKSTRTVLEYMYLVNFCRTQYNHLYLDGFCCC